MVYILQDDIVLEKRNGTYTIPCSESPDGDEAWTHILNITPMEDGTEAKTFTIPEPVTDNPKYEMLRLPSQFLQALSCTLPEGWQVSGIELLGPAPTSAVSAVRLWKWRQTSVRNVPTAASRSGHSLATAIIVLIHKGDEVLLVHARNFKGNFDSLVAGFVETGESLEEAVHREVMEETGLHHYQYQILRFPAMALSKRTDDRFYS